MYDEQCDSGPEEECGEVCLSLLEPHCTSVKEERCVEVESSQCEERSDQEVCGDIEVAECEARVLRVREEQCNTSLVRLCGQPQSRLECDSRTEQLCLPLPDIQCQVELRPQTVSLSHSLTLSLSGGGSGDLSDQAGGHQTQSVFLRQ